MSRSGHDGSLSPNLFGMLRFGIVGTNFVSAWFAAASRRAGCEPAAVFSRDQARAEEFAGEHSIPRALDSLPALLAEPTVDAVYLASPNAAHLPQALQALQAGKHVLCEKTLGTDLAQTQQIVSTARELGLVVLEAVRPVHDPVYDLIRENLPRLGALRQARFEKLQYSSRYDRVRAGEQLNAFDPSLGNSALADIGVYTLQPALNLFGTPVRTCGASVRLANGFEASGTLVLDYDSLVVTCNWSKITEGVTGEPSVIIGEQAAMTIDSLSQPGVIRVHERGGAVHTLLDDGGRTDWSNMPAEIAAFAGFVERGEFPERFAELSLTTRALMDEQLAR